MLCRLIRTASPDLFLLFTLYRCIKNITVSESRFLTAQLGYKVTFTLVHAGKYWTEDKSKTDTLQKLNTTQESKQHKTHQNKTSCLIRHLARKRGGHILQCSRAHTRTTVYGTTGTLVYQCLNGLAPSYLADDCQLVSNVRPRRLRSSDSVTCAVRRTRTIYGDRCFAIAGPRVWNSLPTELRQSNSLGQFKRQLKTRLFGLWDHTA